MRSSAILGTLRAACACGLCVAMAYFTRYTAIALMPAVTAGILLGSAPGRRLAALGVFGAGLVAGLIPHCALTWKIFGRLFYDEAWRSLAFRHFGDGNWAFIENNPFRGTWSVLCHDPGRLLTNALAGVGNYLSVDLPHQLAGRDGPVAWWLVLCLAAGAALSWQRRVAPALVTLLASLGYASLVAVTFFTWERIMLPLLPLLMVPIAWSLVHLPATPLRRRRFGRARVLMSLAVALLAVAGVASQLPARLLSFVASHPRREVEVARDLVRRDGPGIVLLSSYDAMRRYVPCLCIPPQHGTHATVVYEGIARILLTRSADYAVFGPNSQGPALYQDLRQTPVPGHLQLLLDEPDVRLYRVAMPPMERLAAGALTVRPQGGQVFELSLELRADAPPEVLAGVGVLGPDGKATTVVLQPAAGRMRSGSLTLPGGMHGRWRLFPRILDRSGTLHAGPELSVEVP